MNFQYLWSKCFKKVRLCAMRNCHIDETSTVESGSSLVDVTFGKHSFCGYDCEMTNVEVGSFCSIANGVIIGGGMHPIEWVSMSPVFYEGRDSVKAKFAEYPRDSMLKTVVGHDVWIGQNVLVKQGVTIGNGAVVGMGSVVTKDIPSYEVWAGNPAKFIKRRFDENSSELLNESKWWDMDDNLLKECAKFIKSPEKFLNCMNKGK